jgi:hypothetical protein
MAARAVCAVCGWRGTAVRSPARAQAMGAKHVCRVDDGVRRTTRRYRCGRCGLEAVYENAGAAEAQYWFGRHSCRKRELALLRTTMASQRAALIDRTPKPCLHKQADHQHGTRACYVLDRCRCQPCAEANSKAERDRERQKAYGRYNKYVNGEHVRAHLAELKEYGIGLKQVAALTGLSNGTLTKIWYGLYADTGRGHERRHGQGQLVRTPSRRVLRSTAEKIFGVEPIPANLGPNQSDHERTPLARLHLRALVALGWSQAKLAAAIAMQDSNFGRVLSGDSPMRRETVDRVEDVYERLSMTLPPEGNQRERIAASRARNHAKARGWLPPLMLEDVDDVELEDAYLDEAAIWRRMHGDRDIRLTKAETAELVRRWAESGRPLRDCEALTGIKPDRHYRFKDQEPAA